MKSIKAVMTAGCLIACLCFTQVSVAQKSKAPDTPSWITMMDDPHTNYFEAVKAFNAYWKHREKPIEEDEIFETGGDKQKEEKLRERRHGKLKPNDPAIKYAFEYKRFLRWQLETEPFVQPDGHIKDMNERIEDWKNQQKLKKSLKPKADSSHRPTKN